MRLLNCNVRIIMRIQVVPGLTIDVMTAGTLITITHRDIQSTNCNVKVYCFDEGFLLRYERARSPSSCKHIVLRGMIWEWTSGRVEKHLQSVCSLSPYHLLSALYLDLDVVLK